MPIHKLLALASLSAFCLTGISFSAGIDWFKKPRRSKAKQRYTAVAAVRGVTELSDVDPEARDFDSLDAMEKSVTSQEKAIQFVIDGKLKVRGLPVQGQTAAISAPRTITSEEEAVIGRQVAANIIAQFGLYKNEKLNEYLNLVGLTVARSAPRKDITWRFAVLDTNIVNAFAAPGGYIFVTKGLLRALQDESQLACVLGHEIAHVSNRHVMREIEKRKMVEAAIPNYARVTAEKAPWMNEVSAFAVQQMWQALTKEDELESDRDGLIFAYNGGYEPHSFEEVMKILKDKARGSTKGQLKFLLSTHPKPEERILAIQDPLKIFPDGGEKLDARFKKSVPTL